MASRLQAAGEISPAWVDSFSCRTPSAPACRFCCSAVLKPTWPRPHSEPRTSEPDWPGRLDGTGLGSLSSGVRFYEITLKASSALRLQTLAARFLESHNSINLQTGPRLFN